MNHLLRIGLMLVALSILLLGSGCKTQQVVADDEPDIQIVTRYVTLNPELTATQENPDVPNSGGVDALLTWGMICGANNLKLNNQVKAIRQLELDQVK